MTILSVVVPATDSPPTLDRCRAALEASDSAPDEVIVVDGPAELSASAARNHGAARAGGDVIVFVDADVEIHPDALAYIRDAFDGDPELTAVFGSYDDAPHAPGLVSAFRNLLHHHVHQHGGGPAETFWTGLGAVRRSSFEAVGGFDEARFPHPSIEDIELGDRLRAAGGRLVLDPRIQGKHLKAWTLRTMLWTDFARRGIPWVALQARTRRPTAALNCGWRHRISALACVVAVLCVLLAAPLVAVAAVGTLVVLNVGFYRLLIDRRGPLQALAGVGLHALFHLVSVAAVPVGLAVALLPALGTARPSESSARSVMAPEGSLP